MRVSLLVLAIVAAAAAQSFVDLRDVKALTFRRGRMTASRRVPAVPQLSCVGGGACRSHSATIVIDAFQCTNAGVDDLGDVQWRCDTDLDADVKLGDITVSCEGYSSSRDPLKLRGSCGLEFSLVYTGRGRGATGGYDARYFAEDHAARQSRYMTTTYDDPSDSSASTLLFLGLAVLAVAVWVQQGAQQDHTRAIPGARGNLRALGVLGVWCMQQQAVTGYLPPTASDVWEDGWELSSDLVRHITERQLLSACHDVVAFGTSEYLPPHDCQVLEEHISRSKGIGSLTTNPQLLRRWEDEQCVKRLAERVVTLQKYSCINPVRYKIVDAEGFGMTFRDMIQALYQTVRHNRTVLWEGDFLYGGCEARNLSCAFLRNSGCDGNAHASLNAEPFAEAKRKYGEADAWLTDPEFEQCFTGSNAQIRWVSALSSVMFDPLPDLVKEARTFRRQLPKNFIGVHIRHGFYSETASRGAPYKSIPEYADAILRTAATYNLSAVYVATDNAEAMEGLSQLLPSSIKIFWQAHADRLFLSDYGYRGAEDSGEEVKEYQLDEWEFPHGSVERKLFYAGLDTRKRQGQELLFDLVVMRECCAFVGTFYSALGKLYLEMAIHFNSRVIPFIAVDERLWRPATEFAFPGDDYFWRNF